MLKQRKTQVSLAVGAGLCALLLGATLPVTQLDNLFGKNQRHIQLITPEAGNPKSEVLPLVSLSPNQRAVQLEAIAQLPASADRNRARYLRASDLINQKQGQQAIALLEGLEQEYALLAPYVALQRARAYTVSGESAKAQQAWTQLSQRYPDHPASAEALFVLGKSKPQYWDQAIAKFPAHPRTIEIVQARLKQNPNQLPLLLVLARHGLHTPNVTSALDRLIDQYAAQLTSEDWEAIAFGYWEKEEYGKAGTAYARAPRTPRNLYRTARGLQLGGQNKLAIGAYQQLASAFPEAPETATALVRIGELVDLKQAMPYLDQAIAQFPEKAADALMVKAEILDQLKSTKSAAQARQSVLTQYPKSEAAAKLRWQQAQQRAKAKDFQGAWQWAHPIATHNPEHELAPEAAFWVGKWASRLGKQAEAKAAFEYVLAQHPESYYAWRSATLLGWDVGDFTTVRQFNPQVAHPAQRPVLMVGSDTLKELYQLGQDRDAWTLWQVEFETPMQPSVAEQFTDGLMRLGVQDYIDGLFMVSSLSWREQPEERSQYQELKRQSVYWQALYPFPFMETIENWSQQRQLNPLLVTALIRQESRFQPKIRSVVGATGLMQVMPDTASWIASQINFKQYKLENPEDNIKLGTWYLDYTHREYANNSLFAVASYNAGPGAVGGWVAKRSFSDPDEFIETIPYAETKGYVKAVFENYWNYLRLYNPEVSERLAKYSPAHPVALNR